MTMKNEPRGAAELGTLDDFLAEEGLLTEVTLRAAKRVIALQLQRAMDDQNITRIKKIFYLGKSNFFGFGSCIHYPTWPNGFCGDKFWW